MPDIAINGSPMSHGGTLTQGATNVFATGEGVAYLNMPWTCPIHGATYLASATSDITENGVRVCVVGDTAACGAVIQSGASTVTGT